MSRQFDEVCHRKNIVTSYIKVLYFVTKFNGKTGSGQRYKGSLQILQMRLSGQMDLINHSKTNKHTQAAEPFSSQRQQKLSFCEQLSSSSAVEGSMALFLCAIASCDHLGEMCKHNFNDSEAAKGIKMHRTKCSEIIKNILGPYFNNELLSDIGDGKYSLLLDESNDVSVNKLLGIVIIYYSYKQGKTIASFLALTKLETVMPRVSSTL